jgi:L-alanine-DL-glutamate epimerase-like enolase superfamily enzyme
MRALSLLDIAVWDLRARILGVGLHDLLGRFRAAVPVVAVAAYPRGARRPEGAGDAATRLFDEGFTTVKVPRWPTPAQTRAVLRHATAGMPEGACLTLDAAWAWDDAPSALAEIREWGDARLGWLEDPFPAVRLDAYEALGRRCEHPLAVGDETTDVALLARHARSPWLGWLRFDATVAGGVTAAQRLAGACALAGVPVALHIHLPLHVHLAAALPAFRLVEAFGPDDEQSDPSHLLFAERLRLREGACAPPSGPGLGVEIDLEFIRRHSEGGHQRTTLGPMTMDPAPRP